MRPGVRAPNKSMLDRIVMNIVHVVNHIFFIADSVIPEPPLPEAALTAFRAGYGASLLGTTRGTPQLGELALDAPPPPGEIEVLIGQLPYAVQVLRQQGDRHHLEWTFPLYGKNRLP